MFILNIRISFLLQKKQNKIKIEISLFPPKYKTCNTKSDHHYNSLLAPLVAPEVHYNHIVCIKQQTGLLIRAATISQLINESIGRKKKSVSSYLRCLAECCNTSPDFISLYIMSGGDDDWVYISR